MSVRFDELPADVRAIVAAGWYAVVFNGLQVWGVFPQLVFAQGFVSNMTGKDGVYERKEFCIVSPPTGGNAHV